MKTGFDAGTIWRAWFPLVVIAFALGCLYSLNRAPNQAFRLVGMALAVLGLLGVVSARYTLGRSFSFRAKATKLVTTGIYSRIRNPIYISGEICFVGIAILLWKPQFLALPILLAPMQIIRARNEARVLEEKFGEEYREYVRRTWF